MKCPSTSVDPARLRDLNRAAINPQGAYVLYWMVAARRTGWNFALQQATELAGKLNTGLLVCEPLRSDYPYASDRLHRFLLAGMRDNQRSLSARGVTYYPWVEEAVGQGQRLLERLAAAACLVVSDDFPGSPRPELQQSVAEQLKVPLQLVDGNGLLPLQLIDKDYPTAYAFRRQLQRALPAFIDQRPLADPLAATRLAPVELPKELLRSWPVADLDAYLDGDRLASLPIDHRIEPVAQVGGSAAAQQRLETFLEEELADYARLRNVPDLDWTSRLSPYLHCGHISVHQVFTGLAARENWHSGRLALKPTGKRSGWWGMSESAEAFLDELVTWRELGYGFCHQRSDYAAYDSLPEWARLTLSQHAGDQRPYRYTYQQFCAAESHDPLWNAAQRQLLREGRMHGYLRMLWGKKILEWSPSPQAAWEIMLELNDRYALDGRDPNSYSGISWCLGRFDRPWGPVRPIFGKIRYMTSKNTARKVAVNEYLARYSAEAQAL